MKRAILMPLALLLALALLADDTNSTPEPAEAAYVKSIEGRAADILKILALDDAGKQTKVHDAIVAQYRALRAWHEKNDAKLVAEKADTNAVAVIRGSLKTIHDAFLARLSESLKPDQVEKVKDKMTYGKVQFTCAGYVSQYPNLSDENTAEILRLLKQAREEAMDGGSAAENTAVFQKYKGKINNYLSKQGVRPEKQTPSVNIATNSASK